MAMTGMPAARGGDVHRGIADEHRPLAPPVERHHHFHHVAGVGLGIGRAAAADYGREMAGERQLGKEQFGQVLRLVGADAETGALRGEEIEGLRYAREGSAAAGDIGAVIGEEPLGQPLEAVGGNRRPGLEQRMLEHRTRPMTHQMAQIGRHDGIVPLDRQYRVQRGEQVWGRIDQRPVEVENDRDRRLRHAD